MDFEDDELVLTTHSWHPSSVPNPARYTREVREEDYELSNDYDWDSGHFPMEDFEDSAMSNDARLRPPNPVARELEEKLGSSSRCSSVTNTPRLQYKRARLESDCINVTALANSSSSARHGDHNITSSSATRNGDHNIASSSHRRLPFESNAFSLSASPHGFYSRSSREFSPPNAESGMFMHGPFSRTQELPVTPKTVKLANQAHKPSSPTTPNGWIGGRAGPTPPTVFYSSKPSFSASSAIHSILPLLTSASSSDSRDSMRAGGVSPLREVIRNLGLGSNN